MWAERSEYVLAMSEKGDSVGTYAVLGQRRARILSEVLREGSGLFSIHAFLPAEASFGFADDMRRKSSGAASASLLLSHWERLQVRLIQLMSLKCWLCIAVVPPASCGFQRNMKGKILASAVHYYAGDLSPVTLTSAHQFQKRQNTPTR